MKAWVVEKSGKYWDGEDFGPLNSVCLSKTKIQAKEFVETTVPVDFESDLSYLQVEVNLIRNIL
jgi:hypothetical protein